MDVWKYEIYFDSWPGYILFNTNNFIFPQIHVLFCLLYKTIVLLAHKNRAVYSNGYKSHWWVVQPLFGANPGFHAHRYLYKL